MGDTGKKLTLPFEAKRRTQQKNNPIFSFPFRRGKRTCQLTLQEELQLLLRAKKGEGAAFELLLRHHLGYITKIASEYRHMGLDQEDLVAEGLVGFVQAIRRYQPHRQNRFISYAYWWIRKNILLALSRESSPYYVPNYRIQWFLRVRRAESALQQKLGRPPTLQELSHHIDTPLNALDKFLKLGKFRQDVSNERLLFASSNNNGETIFSTGKTSSPLEKWIKRESLSQLREAVRKLPKRERSILITRYGLESEKPCTLREIAQGMGMTRERVRQIEIRALSLLSILYKQASGKKLK